MKFDMFATVSMNGYIASVDGSEDCFSEDNWVEFKKVVLSYGNLIWGKNTYEKVLAWGEKYINDFEEVKIFVLTYSGSENKFSNVIFCKNLDDLSQKMEANNVSKGLVSGGVTLYTDFLNQGLIGKIILNYNSIIIDNGIPLFRNNEKNNIFNIKNSKIVNNKIIQIEMESEN